MVRRFVRAAPGARNAGGLIRGHALYAAGETPAASVLSGVSPWKFSRQGYDLSPDDPVDKQMNGAAWPWKGVLMTIRAGNDGEQEFILSEYPYTAQAMHQGGTLIITAYPNTITGFAWSFRRDIPAGLFG